LTLPLLITLLDGTAWSAFLSENTALIYGLATTFFVFGLLGVVGWVQHSETHRFYLPSRRWVLFHFTYPALLQSFLEQVLQCSAS